MFVERLRFIKGDNVVALSLLLEDFLDILYDGRILLQCLHKVVLDVPRHHFHNIGHDTSQVSMITASVRGPEERYATGGMLYGLICCTVTGSNEGLR